MKKYNITNNIIGWIMFIASAIVYVLTIEPTASFWDCPEFITAAYKLEVGHPPGSPIFMLTGNFFSQFASDPSQVAKMVNTMSALCSAFTILFLFWTITHLTRKLVMKNDSPTLGQTIIVMGSGIVGALAYTFSDTFWFSAAEGEVYAYSSLCTAAVFWLILKWENVADRPHSDRWIVAIAYLMGLSIGVHLLNLLTIPAIVLVYYFKKYPNATAKGAVKALLLSFGLVVVLMYGIIPGVFKVAGWFELLFVNQFGLSFNTGLIIYCVLVIGVLIWGLIETLAEEVNQIRMKISFAACIVLMGIPFMGGLILGVLLSIGLFLFMFMYKKAFSIRVFNTCLLCLMVILIGYSSFALTVIRSSANPPMDQNSPEDVFSLTGYLNREQYGDRPLFYGPSYASNVIRDTDGRAVGDEGYTWIKKEKTDPNEKDTYVKVINKFDYEYEDNMLFPRMYSNRESSHISGYKYWANIDDVMKNGKATTPPPTFFQNIRFFFSYQLNFMYWRYFMWNFSGRQNDIQGSGEITHGNWITGINFIDNHILGLGDQSNLPPEMANNKGRNSYFMLPFLLGIIGLLFQAFSGRKGIQGFWITFFLFFMTGIAIVLYLNQTPYQPRERDYAYAGSFYAYCIWIGIGVAGIAKFFKKYVKLADLPAGILATLLTVFIPIRMGAQNWDDHDRSNRYTTRDFGFNYLQSCEPNAVIFTYGDNDTFPLWYAQEVEGFRTDVRVCNLSYLQTDWYIDQMKRQSYDSEPLPISWNKIDYAAGSHEQPYFLEAILPSLPEMLQSAQGSPSTRERNNHSELWKYVRAIFEAYAPYIDDILAGNPADISCIDMIRSNDESFQKMREVFGLDDLIPTRLFSLKIDSADVMKAGLMPDSTYRLAPEMVINLKNKRTITKSEIMVLNMLAENKWKRPIYYATTVPPETHLGLSKYFRLDGLSYRIMPYETGNSVGTDIMFDNMVNKFKWGNANDPKVYLDENVRRLCRSHRMMCWRLVMALVEEKQFDKAVTAIDTCMFYLPSEKVGYDTFLLFFSDAYFKAGEKEKAQKLLDEFTQNAVLNLEWYNKLPDNRYLDVLNEVEENLGCLRNAYDIYNKNNPDSIESKEPNFGKECEANYVLYATRWAKIQQKRN